MAFVLLLIMAMSCLASEDYYNEQYINDSIEEQSRRLCFLQLQETYSRMMFYKQIGDAANYQWYEWYYNSLLYQCNKEYPH